ncbi:MAG: hypothetical protein EAZ35_09340 [Sphingobacteriia bacterium]|nr:MAG: hypothetical protein EAZ35_09340 [Sphingobacteriia bacterium]
MKQIAKHLLGIIIVSLTISCTKDNNLSDTDNIPGLPPVTQIGANTFGCLVNGKPWIPSGNNGTANLSIDYDPGINNGYFSVAAYNISSTMTTYIILGIKDSVLFLTSNKTIKISKNEKGAFLYDQIGICRTYSDDNRIYSNGSIQIEKYDKNLKIISGRFNCKLYNTNCNDTIEITKGRFDFKF